MSATFADRAFELQQQGADPSDIVSQLVREGASPGLARICVGDLDWADDEAPPQDDAGTGLLWLMGGLLLTGVTFMLAANGGKYIIAVGPIVYGLSRLLKR